MRRFRMVATLGALALGAGVHGAGAAVVKTQPPCDPVCVSLDAGSGGFYTARKITFVAPGPGIAIVSFQGTLYCGSNNVNLADFSIQTQIVENNQNPSGGGPGGLDLLRSTEPSEGITRSFTINLASQRVFAIAGAGTRTYRFRLLRSLLSASTGCSVRNGALTVLFID
jgi:hypothetical protein